MPNHACFSPFRERFCSMILLAGVLIVAAMPTADAIGMTSASAVVDPEPVQPARDLPYVPGEIVVGWQPEAERQAQSREGRLDVDRTSAEWQQAVETLSARTDCRSGCTAGVWRGSWVAVPGQERPRSPTVGAALGALRRARLPGARRGYRRRPVHRRPVAHAPSAPPAAWDPTFGPLPRRGGDRFRRRTARIPSSSASGAWGTTTSIGILTRRRDMATART